MSEVKKNKDLLSGSLVRNMIMFTIPVVLSGVLQLVFNAADLIVVGKFDKVNGSLAQAAIGSTGSMINLILGIFLGVSVGVNVVVARLIGQKNQKELSLAVGTAMSLGFVAGALIAVLGFIFTKPLLVLIGTDSAVMPFAVDYLRIYFIGAPFAMIYNFGSAIMRASGDTKKPMIFLTIGGVANVIMNLFTVIVLGLGVKGVAIATTSSNLIACVFIIIELILTDKPIKLNLKCLKINKQWAVQILQLGLPAGIQGTLFSISNVVVQGAINSFGDPNITAGNGNAFNVENFIFLAMNGFYQTAITFTGQCCGAKKYDMLKKIHYIALVLVAGVGIVLGAAGFTFREQLMEIYSSNRADIEAGMWRMGVICLTYFTCGLMDVTTGIVRGMGKSFVPMIITLIGVCGFRVIWIYTVFEMWNTTTCLYISYPISWTVTFIALFIYTAYSRNKLIKKSNLEILENNA